MAGQILIWLGAVLAAMGVAGIVWCMWSVHAARPLGDEVLRARMRKLVPINLGALMVSTIGLLSVIVGLVLR